MMGGVGICVWPKTYKFLRVLNALGSFHPHRFPRIQSQNQHRIIVDVDEATSMLTII